MTSGEEGDNDQRSVPLFTYSNRIQSRFHLPFTSWSRGESNPRPNKATPEFLHVYLVIDCRLKADHEQPTKQRSPVRFAPGVGPTVS